jgi:cytochrome P450
MNFLSEEVRRNPYPVYNQFRSTSPLVHDAGTGLWMIFDYAGVKRVLSDHDAFSASPSTAGHPHPKWLIFLDPPRHTKLRALIMRAFTPRVVAKLEPRIQELSRGLLDPAIGRGEMGLAEEFSIPLPMMVIAEMIGIPSSDWARFRAWSDVILRLSYTMFNAEEAAAASADYFRVTAEMSAYLPVLIEQRRATPGDELLTNLVEAEVEGERLSHEEILAFVQLLLVAGQETTANLINNAVLCLIDHPDQLARLRTKPDLLPSAIEEVLRYRSPIQWMYRATKCEVEMHGQMIPAGKLVLAMIGSANRDPQQFPDPERFDIAREPNAHIAFSHGIHFCIGAALSRLESKIALSLLLDRMTSFELATDQPWEPRKALNVHGPTRLAIRFEASKQSAAPA